MPYLYALSDEDAALIAEGNVLGHAELEGVGLKGYFYDLKQTKDRQPTGLRGSLTNEQEVVKALRDYFKSDWRKKKLSKYYRSADAFFMCPLFICLRFRHITRLWHLDWAMR